MKKVLIARELDEILRRHDSFLNRVGIHLLTASSNDELLEIHRAERADLIITRIDLPGTGIEQVASSIREDKELQRVRLLIVCSNTRSDIEMCSRCAPHAVVLQPVNHLVLSARALQLLDIAWRENYREIINIAVRGNAGNENFLCSSRDISISGMLIETEKMLRVGDRIICSFSLPDSKRINAAGRIVRLVTGIQGKVLNQYGVKFLQMSSEERKNLESFMNDTSLFSDRQS